MMEGAEGAGEEGWAGWGGGVVGVETHTVAWPPLPGQGWTHTCSCPPHTCAPGTVNPPTEAH